MTTASEKASSADVRAQFGDLWVEEAAFPALMPASNEDVMSIIAWCRKSGWQVLPAGQGHSFSTDFQVPAGVMTVVSSMRDRIADPDPVDLVVEAEAGVPAAFLAEQVNESGFRLDGWPADYTGSVGGLLCGSRGPRVRHLLLGADIVDGRGRSLRFGGRVRKDVSGFDIAALLVGSMGRLAWLDRAYLRLTPKGAPAIQRLAQAPDTGAAGDLPLPYAAVQRALDPEGVLYQAGD